MVTDESKFYSPEEWRRRQEESNFLKRSFLRCGKVACSMTASLGAAILNCFANKQRNDPPSQNSAEILRGVELTDIMEAEPVPPAEEITRTETVKEHNSNTQGPSIV